MVSCPAVVAGRCIADRYMVLDRPSSVDAFGLHTQVVAAGIIDHSCDDFRDLLDHEQEVGSSVFSGE